MLSPIAKLLFVSLPAALAADIFVSPNGSGSGSLGSPYGSIQAAVDAASPGDTIFLREGTYTPSANIQIRKSGTSSNPYTITSYEGEVVIVDGDNMPGTPVEYGGSLPQSQRGVFHLRGADWWRLINLTVTKGPYGIYVQDGSNNYFERIVSHSNYESGFHLQNSISNTQLVNCDSYYNADPRKNGKSADGISIKEGSGSGNVIRGCRVWDNSDDGIDFWEFQSPISVSDCLVFDNGFNHWGFNPHENDGNGVKLGGSGDTSLRGPVDHTVTNTFSWGNLRRGFTDNNMRGDMLLTRNTAWKNGEQGFNARSSSATFQGNLAAENAGSTSNSDQFSFTNEITSSGNSWDGSENWSDSSFVTTNDDIVSGPRGADGKLPAGAADFLVPSNGANLGARIADWQ